MDGPYMLTRNKWQQTPLERINQAINEAKKQLKIEKQNLQRSTEPVKETMIQSINNLTQTVKMLKQESKQRKVKVDYLNKKRENLIEKIFHIRKQKICSNRERRIGHIIKKVNTIDRDLGPFKRYGEQFYLG